MIAEVLPNVTFVAGMRPRHAEKGQERVVWVSGDHWTDWRGMQMVEVAGIVAERIRVHYIEDTEVVGRDCEP